MATQPKIQPQAMGEVVELQQQERLGESLTRLAMRRLRRDYLTMLAIVVLIILSVLSFSAPLLTEAMEISATDTNAEIKYTPMFTDGHLLGTDRLGRDHLARLLYGGRISMSIAAVAAVSSTIIGIAIGLVAGYYQGGQFGVIDDVIMWFVTTLNSIPTLLLLILLGSVLVPSVSLLIGILTFVSWSGTMRLVRGETISQRGREYILSAQAIGAKPTRIMFVHILPNVFSVLIISLMLGIGTLILVEAALSFLGVGVRPPTPSWGIMLADAQSAFRQAPFLAIIPGLLISVTVLCLYIIGDGLRDAFDPQAAK